MATRFVSLWFRYIGTDLVTLRNPHCANKPVVLKTATHGRMVVAEANILAEKQGVYKGMVLADARAIIPALEVVDEQPAVVKALLDRIANYCIRFTPGVAVEPPDSLVLDVSGCTHLWGGEKPYLFEIARRFRDKGFYLQAGMADTIGAAWAITRYGKPFTLIEAGNQQEAIAHLPAAALRLAPDVAARLNDLGLRTIANFMKMPPKALRRRFGPQLLLRINQALGSIEEITTYIEPVIPWQERLPCFDPIVTAGGIAIAVQKLLDTLCQRLQQQNKGLRKATLKYFRIDGKTREVQIATHRPSASPAHLFRLFEMKLPTIEPALGIELFVLEAPVVEDHPAQQQDIWKIKGVWNDNNVSELVDRLVLKIGRQAVQRYLPDEHHWPERSYKATTSLHEQAATKWQAGRPRPIQLLPKPESISVTAPVPDYPPMNFRYKGKLHKILRADGPERIEQEWWIQEGQHRDYYVVEDEDGHRYWLFRSGHYDEEYKWYVHGFFA